MKFSPLGKPVMMVCIVVICAISYASPPSQLKNVRAVVSHYANYVENFRNNPNLIVDILAENYSEPNDRNVTRVTERRALLEQASYRGKFSNGPSVVLLRSITESDNKLKVGYYMAGSWRMFDRRDSLGEYPGLSFCYVKVDTWEKLNDGSWVMASAENDPSEPVKDVFATDSQIKRFEQQHQAILARFNVEDKRPKLRATASLKSVGAVVKHYENYVSNFRNEPTRVVDILAETYFEPEDKSVSQATERKALLDQASYKGKGGSGPSIVLIRRVTELKGVLQVAYYMEGAWRNLAQVDAEGNATRIPFTYIKIDTWVQLEDGSYVMVSASKDLSETLVNDRVTEEQRARFRRQHTEIIARYNSKS